MELELTTDGLGKENISLIGFKYKSHVVQIPTLPASILAPKCSHRTGNNFSTQWYSGTTE